MHNMNHLQGHPSMRMQPQPDHGMNQGLNQGMRMAHSQEHGGMNRTMHTHGMAMSHMDMGSMNPVSSMSGEGFIPRSEEVSCSLPVPEYKIGWIIGKRGSYINQLAKKSGASISISDTSSKEYGTIWKYVQIRGTARAVDRAKKLFHIRLERLEPRPLEGKDGGDQGDMSQKPHAENAEEDEMGGGEYGTEAGMGGMGSPGGMQQNGGGVVGDGSDGRYSYQVDK